MKAILFSLLVSLALLGCKSDHDRITIEPSDPVDSIPWIPLEPPIMIDDTALVSWSAPTTRVNGDDFELYEIEHYTITHMWDDKIESINVEYDATEHKFTDLSIGNHEFYIVTVDIDGLESEPSDTVSKMIE